MSSSPVRWEGRSVVVLGMAKSGIAAAKLLHSLGAKVLVNDRKQRSDCPEAEELERMGIRVILGGHPPNLLDGDVDLLVKNPGIPYRVPPVREAIRRGIPVVTEVEIAAQMIPSPIAAITGSNGKTTTTSLVGHMLSTGGLKARVAGNIGRALSELVGEAKPEEWLVVELSSFQLKGTETFHPRVAALLNIVPAHLDYHGTMEDYIASKMRLFQNQTAADEAILNRDCPTVREMASRLEARVRWFSRRSEVPCGAFVREGWMVLRTSEGEERTLLSVEELSLPGVHNLENALAAVTIASACGCPEEGMIEGLRTFRGVPHRLEYAGTVEGVRYINDSKATNAQAAIRALESFSEPIVWIAGGLDRGDDFAELVPHLARRVKGVVAYGEAGPRLLKRAEEAGVSRRRAAKDVLEAVELARRMADEGDVVLLSPACASWDLYTSFEERGDIFKEAVHRLVKKA
ncbi:UDP-N-acetylmuramoyl-L-alanine--D-glutamate ligase [Planifilum fimeticola]|jgi:UDP-N-acetylmuramoylalanine--D-glutamate ligase